MPSAMIFTVITQNGRADVRDTGDYFSVLSRIYDEYGRAGSNWDRPNMLLINGEVVIPSGLADIAWSYGHDYSVSQTKMSKEVHDRHFPAFLKDGNRK